MTGEVGIVVPAYRPDPDRLCQYLDALEAKLAPEAIHVELDAGAPAVREQLAGGPATVNAVPHRRGKGTAVTAGFERLGTDVLAFTDADGSTPPAALAEVLEPVVSGSADVGVGSRRHPDAEVRVHQSRVRRRFGDLLVQVARRLLPIRLHDYQCGAKAFHQETWQAVRGDIGEPGFAWDIDVLTLAALRGAAIQEIPITWDDQPGSTVPPVRTGIPFARALLRGWHRSRCAAGSRLHRTLDHWWSEAKPLLRTRHVADAVGREER